jgi:hypothetical protein
MILVRVCQVVVVRYCDFCQESKTDGERMAKEKLRRRAFYSCTVCGQDLCERHATFVTLPRGTPESEDAELEIFRTRNRDSGDARICPMCGKLSLFEITLLALESLKRRLANTKDDGCH